jgi:dolichyl-phosphate beta-glucosyltransferase
MLSAAGNIRLFMDADNSTDLSHFDQMKPLFDEGIDVVICSRDHKDVANARQAVPQPLLKRVLGDIGNLFIQLIAVPGIWDTQCGFKAFTAAAAERIFSVSVIDRWGFDIEALALCRRFDFRLSIIPADWIDDVETHVSMWNYFGTILETLKIRWNLISGIYEQEIPAIPVKDRPRLSDH